MKIFFWIARNALLLKDCCHSFPLRYANKWTHPAKYGVKMFGSKAAKREKFKTHVLNDVGPSCQATFVKRIHDHLVKSLPYDTAMKITAALSNYIFFFGYVAPEHLSDTGLMKEVQDNKIRCLGVFSNQEKWEFTAVLIVLAAVSQTDLKPYLDHMRDLAKLGFAIVGRETPDVSGDIQQYDLDLRYLTLLAQL